MPIPSVHPALGALARHRIALVFALAACTAADQPEIVYDPCSPLEVALSPTVSAPELAGVIGAIELWRARLPVQLHVGSGARAADVLPVSFVSGSALRGVYWDARGTISIDRDLIDPDDYDVALAHELGHAFGLPHVADRPSVMNVGNLTIAPTAEDATQVAARWASCDGR